MELYYNEFFKSIFHIFPYLDFFFFFGSLIVRNEITMREGEHSFKKWRNTYSFSKKGKKKVESE